MQAWIDLTSSSSPLGTCIYTHTDTCLHIKPNLHFGYFLFSSLCEILVHTWTSCRVGAQLAEDEESSPLFCPPWYRCAIRSTHLTPPLLHWVHFLARSHPHMDHQRDFLFCFFFLNLKHWRVRSPFFFLWNFPGNYWSFVLPHGPLGQFVEFEHRPLWGFWFKLMV